MKSIIIIVKNDIGIKKTLDELIRLTKLDDTELLVVDSSNMWKSGELALSYPTVKWINFKPINKGKEITIPEQRNLGIKSAKGDIVVFLDANCMPSRTWLTQLTKPIVIGKEKITAGAVYSNGNKTRHDKRLVDIKGKIYLDSCPTINMAFKKEIIEHVGLFDEKFEYGSDVDFSWRAINEGYKIRYVPEARVEHSWGSKRDDTKRSYRYGQAKARLYRKYPKRILSNPIGELYPCAYILYILLLPITLWVPYYPILILIPLIKNYKSNPFTATINNFIFGIGILFGAAQELFSRSY